MPKSSYLRFHFHEKSIKYNESSIYLFKFSFKIFLENMKNQEDL
jgi:hypothetical protein